MSATKTSQIHDGFATIRSRGLQRSRSRVEQLERLKPISNKSDSMPLYENNNIRVNNDININNYGNNCCSSSGDSNCNGDKNQCNLSSSYERYTTLDIKPLREKLRRSDAIAGSEPTASSNSCSSFKSSAILSDPFILHENIAGNETSALFPPPSPCYETTSNGFHTPRTPDSPQSTAFEYYPYSRPTSPLYERFLDNACLSHKTSATGSSIASSSPDNVSTDLYSSSPKPFTLSYYRKGNDPGEYALQKVTKKPPISFKTQSLQYRKSYSHPTQTIYETVKPTENSKYDNCVRNYYNPMTNYYDPSEISYVSGGYSIRRQTVGSAELLGQQFSNAHSDERLNGYERRYATLAHPKDIHRYGNHRHLHQQEKQYAMSSVHSASQSNVDYLDPLDCKIGCQTTLRSKPRIPWYELAIKKDHRRQSCPPLEVTLFYFLLFNFLGIHFK